MLAHIHPSRQQFACRSRPGYQAHPGNRLARPDHQVPRAPLPAARCYPRRCGVPHHIRGHYPSFIAPTGSCVRPNPSHRLWIDLLRRVLAGCRQSLLGDGPSRRYLCNPDAGAWTPTPWCPAGAHARFFPADDGLTSGQRRSAHQSPCNATSTGPTFRGCSQFVMFRLPRLLDPPVAPTAETMRLWVARPFTPRRTRLVTCPEQWYRYVSVTSN
jgi:hypothetical protein